VITDEEVQQFRFNYMAAAIGNKASPEEAARQALAAFLEARVPKAKPNSGFNACREQVLRGKS
jgi:hypothetical protein